MNHVLAALGALETATARRIEVRQPAAEAFDRELRRALANTVWRTGCTSWYLDENGNDPSQWPWTYHKRTARLDPTAYAIGPAP